MPISITWSTKVINVTKDDPAMTLVSSDPFDVYELDTDAFRLTLKDLEGDETGQPFDDTHTHNTTVTVGGVTLARVVKILNGYTVTFEDGSYAVNLTGSNNNIADVLNLNTVQVRAGNTAGLADTNLANVIWDEVLANHLTAGSTGKALDDAGAAGNPWGTPVSGNTDAGTFGELVGKKLLTIAKFLGLK